jgi:hypothetical protein
MTKLVTDEYHSHGEYSVERKSLLEIAMSH